MNARDITTAVVTDTSIVINLAHASHLPLLGQLPSLRFVVPDEVVAEVLVPEQSDVLQQALAAGWLQHESLCGPEELHLFVELSALLGRGEASCLALAKSRGWLVACDERRLFLREARTRLGPQRVLNTPGIYVLAIRAGLLSIEEADAAKQLLEEHRFRMNFDSFADVV